MSVVIYNGKKMKPFDLMNFEEEEEINPNDCDVVEAKPNTPIL